MRPILIAILSLGSAGLALLASQPIARSQTSPKTTPAAATALASSSTVAPPPEDPAPQSHSGPPAPLQGIDVPVAGSKLPSLEEWKNGVPFIANRSDLPCTFKRLREYVQITCRRFAGAGLFAGSPEGVTVFAAGDTLDEQGVWTPPLTVIVAPLRRGETRLLNLLSISGGGYDIVAGKASGWISLSFREGAQDPMVLTRFDGRLADHPVSGI